jgi:hypothetical protein
MRSKGIVCLTQLLIAVCLLAGTANRARAQALPSGNFWGQGEVMFEVVGQVKNSPPAGPGLPPTSVQYGYLSHVKGLSDDQIFLPGVAQNEASALFTFYNDSITEKVTVHGSLRIVIREGTTTIYYNPTPSGDFTTPLPDSFRQGTPILTTTWRHQVIIDNVVNPNATPRTNLFFVTFVHTITSVTTLNLGSEAVSLGKVGDEFRQHFVGGVDFTGNVDGKFAGYAIAISAHHN